MSVCVLIEKEREVCLYRAKFYIIRKLKPIPRSAFMCYELTSEDAIQQEHAQLIRE